MHSFDVNIRICQPENSDVHQKYFHIINLLKSDVPRKIVSTLYLPNFCNSYEISKLIASFLWDIGKLCRLRSDATAVSGQGLHCLLA